jgi:hypothetical protein
MENAPLSGKFPAVLGEGTRKLLKTPFSGNSLEDLLLGEGVTRGSQLGGGP